jgi:hypothetical protein
VTSRRPVTADDPHYTQSISTPADTAPTNPTAAIYAPPSRYLAHGLTEPSGQLRKGSSETLRAHNGIEGVYSVGISAAILERSLAASLLLGKVKCVTHDLDADARRLLQQDLLAMVMDQDPEHQVQLAVFHLSKMFGFHIVSAQEAPKTFRIFFKHNLLS